MLLSEHKSAFCLYASYITGAELDSVSPLAWVLSQTHNLATHGVEQFLRQLNPLVCIANENDPEAVSVGGEDEEAIVAYCAANAITSRLDRAPSLPV